MPDIVHRIRIHAPQQRVYDALTLQTGFAGWWTREPIASPAVGTVNEFRSGYRSLDRMKVLGLTPCTRVGWECVDGADGWIGTKIVFELNRQSQTTSVLFAHRGWREQVAFTYCCSTKWATYLFILKSLCEKGKGRPYPDDIDIG